jgi:hypothetical protein
MGDHSATMQQHGMSRRRNHNHLGFSSFYLGTPRWGLIRVVDLGYVFADRAGRGRARMRGNISLHDQCQQVSSIHCQMSSV